MYLFKLVLSELGTNLGQSGPRFEGLGHLLRDLLGGSRFQARLTPWMSEA